jgi:DoxX-like family
MAATILGSVPLQASTATPSTRSRRVGLALTGVAVLFLVFDVVMKFIVTPEAVQATSELGWPMHHMPLIGMIELICLTLYLLPRTALLGAILWTGYLGGAIATHLRVDNPLFSHTIFPIYVAAFIWGGLYLRDARVRALIAPRR